ncbi:bacillithiol biosynthesis deacetylase BshB2 [Neobacillus drentensis]|uniref:bacillithiol biosynthesis deacetylase BshB2 n=1 Tax=Neobacillus drentensis TaxID=220684 RepID=UPI002FFEB2B7
MYKKILAIYPHPDDESFGKAGSLAIHAMEGAEITLVCATSGQMGRRMGKPFFANRETLWEIREKELKDACDVIGIRDLRMWRMLDKTLQFEDPEELAGRVEAIVKEVRPELVYSYYPNYAVHPDHDALAEAVILAISRLPKQERPIVRASAFSKNCEDILGCADLVIDVSEVLNVKLDALRAHRSQTEFIIQKLEQSLADQPGLKDVLLDPYRKERYWTIQL